MAKMVEAMNKETAQATNGKKWKKKKKKKKVLNDNNDS